MKIVIIGIGSIGKRHLSNLINLGYKDICLIRRDGKPLGGYEAYPVFSSIEEACLSNSFTHAFITTPTALHYKSFVEVADQNIPNIYLEKPVAHALEEGNLIKELAYKKNLNVVVGYDLHFDPGLIKVKELLDTKTLGRPLTFQAEVGQYLPDWRPHEDYRNGMSAKKELGGGVMLDLVHEFDYLNWIFGPIVKISGVNSQVSELEIDTEDVSLNILTTKEGVVGSLYLDYLQKQLSRKCKVVCEKGTIIWDYTRASVKWMSHSDPIWKEFSYKDFERNDRFVEIANAFMKTADVNDKRLSNLSDAIVSLSLVEAAKRSNIENKSINQ